MLGRQAVAPAMDTVPVRFARHSRIERTVILEGIMDTARRDTTDQLIATYRELNIKVRPLPETELAKKGADGSVHDIVDRMRADELKFAQALKERLTGVPSADVQGENAPIIGTETDEDTTLLLISQFGTARATTLSMIQGVSDQDWSAPFEDNSSLADRIQSLAANDALQLERIRTMLGIANTTNVSGPVS
jgi:hypothetical protein